MANDKRGRGAPQLCRDYYGVLYIIIDDDGEPVSSYHAELEDAICTRDNYCDGKGNRPWVGHRIAEVGYKVVGVDEPDGLTIADDPRSEGDE